MRTDRPTGEGAVATRQKVVFFTTGMTAGGAERVVATLANALATRGVDVVVAMLKGDESAYALAPAVQLRSADLSPGLRNLSKAMRFYRQLVQEESPDVIASFSTKSDLIALLGKILFRSRGRLVVSDRADPYTRAPRMQSACNVLYRWSDALVCQSQKVADYYGEKCARANTFIIANPLDEGCVGDPWTGERQRTVISVGRLSEQKNHRLAIRAFRRLQEKDPDLQLKIFGSGPLEAELEELIRAEKLERSVVLEGVVPNVIRQNTDASLFLFTSSHEGYPNALMEAAAAGIPAVTTDFSPGTAREIIDDGVNGYIVPVGDEDAIVRAALKALSGQLAPKGMVAAAHRIREKHATERILQSWLYVFGLQGAARTSP